jgi:hypothetical protein
MKPEVHYLAHKNPPLIRILNRLNSAHIFQHSLCTTRFNIILPINHTHTSGK